jgi:DNA-binding NtrC family response regulator
MKGRILVIDDEPRWIDFAKSDLSKFEIVVARDVKTAIAELEADQFDLVIASSRRLDMLETIRKRFADKPVVVMTVQPTTQEALTAYRLGAVRYFPKSFGQRDLLKHVKEVIPASANAG